MDTSSRYVKMCEKAMEIQGLWTKQEGDWFEWEGHSVCLGHYVPIDSGTISRGGHDHDSQHIDYGQCTWLPRQDQLQEMLGQSARSLIRDFWDFNNISGTRDVIESSRKYEYLQKFTSIEQLWLAFVMKASYNKLWINGEWETGDDGNS